MKICKKMEILESKITNTINSEFVTIPVVCPICHSKKEVKVPKSVMNRTKNLATISIQEDITCNHHFQVFIDKNLVVRGYQKVDFQIGKNAKNSKKLRDHHLKNNISEKIPKCIDSIIKFEWCKIAEMDNISDFSEKNIDNSLAPLQECNSRISFFKILPSTNHYSQIL